MIGPATEEAIELGLAYLASAQNEDGSWSLQVTARDVLCQSDSAAPACACCAFRRRVTHGNINTPPSLPKDLKLPSSKIKKSNGDLYRLENRSAIENRGRCISHGIAATSRYASLRDDARTPVERSAQSLHRITSKRLSIDAVADGVTRPRSAAETRPSPVGMMMAVKSGELSNARTFLGTSTKGIDRWLSLARSRPHPPRSLPSTNPYVPDTRNNPRTPPSPTMDERRHL